MAITLREITMARFREFIWLGVAENRKNHVATGVHSLAEAKADGVSNPRAIYSGERMVGFVMYDFVSIVRRGYVTHVTVDSRSRGNGYDGAAMAERIDRLEGIPACRGVQRSFAPESAAAERPYLSVGFEHTGETVNEETVGVPVRS